MSRPGVGGNEMTIRQRIMAELEKGPMTARDLSKAIRSHRPHGTRGQEYSASKAVGH